MPCDSPYWVVPKGRFDKVPVPCGRCPNCKQRRVNDWTFRMLQEDKVSSSAYFITLTYDNEHVPLTEKGYMTLVKSIKKLNRKGKLCSYPHPKSVQAFIKRLRKDTSDKLRYYFAGEYGSLTFRPHYHLILFNLSDISLVEKHWKWGHVDIGTVSGRSIAYTTKYIDKKKRVPVHRNDDRLPEFSLMSKGLGLSYLSPAMRRYYSEDVTRMHVRSDGRFIAIPRYYRKHLFDDDDLAIQLDYIQSLVYDKDRVDEYRIKLLYGGTIDLDRYRDLEKEGRYLKFYNKQKLRE